jgi:hypothetical protein
VAMKVVWVAVVALLRLQVAAEHGSPLAPEEVVGAHRASQLATWCVWTCSAVLWAWIVRGDVW